MIEVHETDTYSKWFQKLKDIQGRARILARLKRVATLGHLGDVRALGDGVSEMRIHCGPGCRIYFVSVGSQSSFYLVVGTRAIRRVISPPRKRWRMS